VWSSLAELLVPLRPPFVSDALKATPMLSSTKIENRQGSGLLVRELLEDCGRRKAQANLKLVTGDTGTIAPGADVKITDTAVSWKDANGDHWFVPFSAIVSIMGSLRHSRLRVEEAPKPPA
jgi:hypothetical protein